MTPATTTAPRRFIAVAIVLPLVLTLVALVIQLVALPRVPDPIAIHWGPTGAADGFGPAWSQVVLSVVVVLGMPLLLALTSLPGLRRGDRGATYRLMGAVAAAISTLGAVLFSWTTLVQVGLSDAHDAPSVLPGMAVAFAAAASVGLIAWFVQPKEVALNFSSAPAEGLDLAPGEHAAWFGVSSMGRVGIIITTVTSALMVGGTVAAFFAGAPIAAVVGLALITLLIVGLILTTTTFRVRVDADGLTAVSVVGFPRFHVALADVKAVAVTDVSPMGEFGGYGLRYTVGAFGLVMRNGPAIDVERLSGRRFVVTVDDAERGASLLESLAQRQAKPAQG